CLNESTRSGDDLAGCVRPYRVMSTTRTAAVTAVTYRSVRKVKCRPTKHSNAATNANAPHTTHMIHEFMLVPPAGRIDGLSRKEGLESRLIHRWGPGHPIRQTGVTYRAAAGPFRCLTWTRAAESRPPAPASRARDRPRRRGVPPRPRRAGRCARPVARSARTR